ncbi:glycosyl hydrolase family 79 C-terminal domain-containing protein [Hamadaea tsunoensis]|uniref:glycosyl hydrolase family 79 C-terminal domain-containing protein n=1 Tax=Hamadaea tsunoensis TaxID=53368 RepID=UPI0004148BE9|nr:glycosyl hydrolase family 79 C-terminal domain-containing protein [Hamadaea tsunoensis]
MYTKTAAALAVALFVLVPAAPAPSAPPGGPPSVSDVDDSAAVVVDTAHPAGRLPADFLGLSFEMRELGIGNLDPGRGNVTALLRTLGPGNVRIGGNTLDRDTLWVPAGQSPPAVKPDWVQDIVTPADVERLRGLLDATGWTAEVGINVGRWDPALGADEARVLARVLGRRLVAVECGNEPDQWVGKAMRPAGYAYADYLADWRACADAVGHGRIAGPDTAGTSSDWAARLPSDEPDRLAMLTVHQYAAGGDATIAGLLSPAQVTSQLNAVAKNLAAANAAGIPLRVDEANSAYSGGVDGVSNRYASALWVLDYSLSLAQAGVAGVNIHGGLGVCNDPIWNGKFQRYTPFCAANKAYELAGQYKAMPVYYGIWLARRMGAGRFLPVTVDSARNVTAYAVRGDDGRLRIALVQKDEVGTAPVAVSLNVGGRDRDGGVLHLTGAALGDEATAVQGSTVDPAGRLVPGPADRVRVRGGVLTLDLAAGSAVLITLPDGASR